MENQLLEALSERQRELLELVSNKVTTSKALAVETGLAPGTIDNLLQNAAKTLQVQGRAAAAQRFRELREPTHAVREAIAAQYFIPEMAVAKEVGTNTEPVALACPPPQAHHALREGQGRPLLKSTLRVAAIVLLPIAALVVALQAYVAVRGYPSCSTAKYVGAAPIALGQPGYHRLLDRDGDGIACE